MDDSYKALAVVAPEIAKSIKEFALKIFGPGAEQVGMIVGDRARLWRLNNLISINGKWERICREKGIDLADGRHLSFAVGLPLLEKASCHDNDFIQERWAHLIASSLRSEDREESSFSLDITYVEILNQLSQLDCEILEYIVENGVESRDEKTGSMKGVQIDPSSIREAHPNTLAHISLEKLVSLGCAHRVLKAYLTASGSEYGAWGQDIVVTLIGLNLYLAASGKTPKWLRREDS